MLQLAHTEQHFGDNLLQALFAMTFCNAHKLADFVNPIFKQLRQTSSFIICNISISRSEGSQKSNITIMRIICIFLLGNLDFRIYFTKFVMGHDFNPIQVSYIGFLESLWPILKLFVVKKDVCHKTQ